MKKKVENIEILRAISILWVLVYHVWVYSGYPNTGINTIIAYGGEVGVTLFFIISGFAIYMNLSNNSDIKFKEFISKRLLKVIPPYYFCMLIIIVFSNNSYLNSMHGFKDIFMHTIFIHNFSPSTHGTINGVFWTMGNIVQFYFIAIILYKIIRKYKVKAVIGSIIFTIIYKVVVYNILFVNESDSILYFIYGRQLLGTIDNFIIGMWIGYMYSNNLHEKINKKYIILSSILIYIVIKSLNSNPLYINSIFSYTWHSFLAIILTTFILCFLNIKFNCNNKIVKSLQIIARLEYNIYLWHLPILIKLTNESFLSKLNNKMFYYNIVFTLIITIVVSVLLNSINYKKIITSIRKISQKDIINILIIIMVICTTPNYVEYIKYSLKGTIKYTKNDITKHNDLEPLVKLVDQYIPKNNDIKYIYLDNNDYEGTMNFWAIRYYLSPRRSIHWNTYAYSLDMNDKMQIEEFLNNIDVDYIIVKNCMALKEEFQLNDGQSYIFKKNKNTNGKLKNMLELIGE